MVISDEAFIASHLVKYPEWENRPGAGDLPMIFSLGEELGLCSGGEVVRDYERALALHRAGNELLIRTKKKSQDVTDQTTDGNFALVVGMDEDGLVLWEPGSDGFSETRKYKRLAYWDSTEAQGVVLYAAKAAPVAL